MSRKITNRIISTVLTIHQRMMDRPSRRTLGAYDPRIPPAFDKLEGLVSTKDTQHFAKCADLLRLLLRYRPEHVVELGSGRTSIVFAAYADKTGAKFTSFEQDESWADAVGSALAGIASTNPVEVVLVERTRLGGKFSRPIPAGADFLYVDAPYVRLDRRVPTHTGKPVYYDAPDFLADHRPAAIVVDVRLDTVDQIREAAGNGYAFRPCTRWWRDNRPSGLPFKLTRHSVFELRPAP